MRIGGSRDVGLRDGRDGPPSRRTMPRATSQDWADYRERRRQKLLRRGVL